MRIEPRIILASSSPRRRELLSCLGVEFTVIAPQVEEIPRPEEVPEAFALRAARDKAEAVRQQVLPAERGPLIVIAADTVVILGRRILGKPRDAQEAAAMLRLLSGRTHRVVTAVCVQELQGRRCRREECFHTDTRVTFRPLDDWEITSYVASGEPMDKAGAYAAQGLGSSLIRRVEGSYTNVVGLPLAELAETLKKMGLPVLPSRSRIRRPQTLSG